VHECEKEAKMVLEELCKMHLLHLLYTTHNENNLNTYEKILLVLNRL